MALQNNQVVPAAEPVGEVRRSQVISTYGIGAIVDLEDGSFMPAGLEQWENQMRGGRTGATIIAESRLQAQLGVNHFRLPPMEVKLENQPGSGPRQIYTAGSEIPQMAGMPFLSQTGTGGAAF